MDEISQSEIPFVPASLKSRYLQVSSSVLWVSASIVMQFLAFASSRRQAYSLAKLFAVREPEPG